MEGPSLLLASEQLVVFKGQKVLSVSGNTKLGKERLLDRKVIDIFSWGKHLVFQFDTFALRVHFLLFGTYEATIDDAVVTGDYQRTREPRLEINFSNGQIKLFNCSLKFLETAKSFDIYDFTCSIMSPSFDEANAYKKIIQFPSATIDDILLEQDIFAGVGNIIKNEVLFLTRSNPHTRVEQISAEKMSEIIHATKTFSLQFYEWRKQFVLRKHLRIYQKRLCPSCGGNIVREKTGKKQRWSYFCESDQRLETA